MRKVAKREHDLIQIRKCDQCGKKFATLVSDYQYGYSIRKRRHNACWVFCSYTCMRAFERPIIEKRQAAMAKKFATSERDERLRRVVYL